MFEHVLPAGTCVAVSLPAGDDFAPPAALHPDEAAFVHASPAARRATFMGGRVAMRAALVAQGADAAETGVPILSTPRGAPAMPPGFVGSISHKRELAVAIVARAAPTPLATIGIDVEVARPLRSDIAPRVLTPAERAALAGLDGAARDAAILFRFAAKEAIYKALDPRVQRLVSFQEAEIVTDPRGGFGAHLSLARGEGPFSVHLHEVRAHGLVIVVAVVTHATK